MRCEQRRVSNLFSVANTEIWLSRLRNPTIIKTRQEENYLVHKEYSVLPFVSDRDDVYGDKGPT
jgi:hypothetical protein